MINLEQKQNKKNKDSASGKWFLQESLPTPKFLKCFQKLLFFGKHILSDFWGMLKTLLI